MKSIMHGTLAGVFLLILLAGCSRTEEGGEAGRITYPVTGKVISIEKERNRVTIDHEEIPDFMTAMVMPFRVKDSTLLATVQPGDSVQGTLVVTRRESWLETLFVIGRGSEPRPASGADDLFRRIYKVGEPLPDFAFVNQDNRRVRLSDFRGKAVAMTFIYSRCPLPDFCILMSTNFFKVQRALANDAALTNRWHLITVSFDPEFDTPEVLRRYGTGYSAEFSTWDFVTEDLKTIREIADGLELIVEDDEGGLIAHNLRTIIIGPDGMLAEILKGNEWTARELEEKMRSLIRRVS
ncbi:MAG: SCO family protein [Bacteroidota bacterium]